MQGPVGIVDFVTLAQGIQIIALSWMKPASDSQGIDHPRAKLIQLATAD